MAKAQMEIMGLVIIVILLTLGLLLVVKFIVLKPESKIRQIQGESQLAANLLNSLLQASTSCNNQQIRALLQDCATSNQITCNGEDACTFVNRTISYILEMTLIRWNKSFNLSASNTDTNFAGGLNFHRGDCSGERESKFSPIKAGGKTIVVDLELCR
jgi:hypothetical protein